jgi:hypothetical protein
VATGRENPEPKMLSRKHKSLAQAGTESRRRKLLMAVRDRELEGKNETREGQIEGCGDG